MGRRKRVPDEHIIRLNDLGLSMETIGKHLRMHETTIKYRLTQLGIEPSDTRRAFAERIYNRLTEAQREWLSDTLHLGQPIDAFLVQLIVEKYNKRNDKPVSRNPFAKDKTP